MRKVCTLVAVVLAVVVGLSPTSRAQTSTVSEATRCEIVKLKALVKELKDKAQCYERSLKASVPVSDACFDRAEHKRERLFARAEERGACKTVKDGASFSTRVDAFLQDVTRSLHGSEAAAKKAAETVKNDAKAAAGDAEVSATKPEKAEKAEGAGAASDSSGEKE